jgi:hypothetical protein
MWTAMLEQQQQERVELRRLLSVMSPPVAATAAPDTNAANFPMVDALAREEHRLEELYARNWAETERFNLSHGFELQVRW